MNGALYSGAGNTFALLDAPLSASRIPALCQQTDVDGVIFSENTFRMRIFNRDGSEAEMCGNGLRCFVRYLIDHAIMREKYTIETLAGTHTAWANGQDIAIQLPSPCDIRWNLTLENYTLHHLNTGVPHAVLFVEDVDEYDLNQLGPLIRHHPLFPAGTNLDLVQLHPLRMRTYERGVERETLACGTGAVASALAAAHLFSLPSPVSIRVQSGDHLKISFTPDWKTVIQEGPARRTGTFSFN